MSFHKRAGTPKKALMRDSTIDSGFSTDHFDDDDVAVSETTVSCPQADHTVPMPTTQRLHVLARGAPLVPSPNSAFSPVATREFSPGKENSCTSPSCRCVTSVKKGRCTHHRPCTPIGTPREPTVSTGTVDLFEEEYLSQAVRSTYSLSDYEDSDDGDSAPYKKQIRFPKRNSTGERTANTSGKSEDDGFFDVSNRITPRTIKNAQGTRVADWVKHQLEAQPATLV